MLWQKGRRSDNVEDVGSGGGGRGFGGGGFGGGRGLGLGGIVILAILGLVFFKDPTALLQGDQQGVPVPQQQRAAPQANTGTASASAEQKDFVRAILGDTEDTWHQIFQEKGKTYVDPKLALFRGSVNTACGSASAAVGPFYCPGDQIVYLDVDFFDELSNRFHAAGDFARAYVIAHEVGHHVQEQLGIFDKVAQARQSGARMEGADGLSVRQELQADCFAGVWANRGQQRNKWLEPGDIESAMTAATAIGDDALQQQARGRVVPDSFTHGTSAQRVKWFKTGFDSGDPNSCNTFVGVP